MSDTNRTAICHNANDGSGDLIAEIPPEVVEAMGLRLGGKLNLEPVGRKLVLTIIRDRSQGS